jgi:hypothetical protein
VSNRQDGANLSTLSRASQYVQYGNLRWLLSSRLRRSGPRVLMSHPMPHRGGHSARRINKLLECLPGNGRYLEIGLASGITFESVLASVRWGVDPSPRFDLKRLPRGVTVVASTSDDFFVELAPEHTFDLVFIDGLHTFRQAYRDLINSCRASPEGFLLIDDVVPCDAASALPDREDAIREHRRRGLKRDPRVWHGDVFKVLLCLSRYHPELAFRTVVGPDNLQAIVWRRDRDAVVSSVDPAAIDELQQATYDVIFSDGIPEMFFPRTEDEAIAEVQRP